MTEIEKKASALLQECGFGAAYIRREWNVRYEALCRAIEAHEAFRQEVSDAVEHYASRWPANARRDIFMSQFGSFIITKPDRVAEALEAIGPDDEDYCNYNMYADKLRRALAVRGLEIREIECD